MKKCTCCELERPEIDFNKKSDALDGLQTTCKICKSLYHKEFKKEKKIKPVIFNKHCNNCNITYSLDNFFKTKAGEISGYCKSCTCQINKDFRIKNKKHYNCKQCYSNIERKTKLLLCEKCYIVHRREYRKNYEILNRLDLEYKLKSNISRSVNESLTLQGKKKGNRSILKYLSYTIKQLKDHLESKFEPWMNWKNHGNYRKNIWNERDSSTWTWHIDHIIPHSTFDYLSMEDDNFKKCWSLENLRPLSAKQNIIDGNRRNS